MSVDTCKYCFGTCIRGKRKTVGVFLGGTAIGLILSNVLNIGGGFAITSDVAYDAKEVPSIVEMLINIIPINPFNSLTVSQHIMVMLTAVSASIGTADIPGSGLVMLTIVLNAGILEG